MIRKLLLSLLLINSSFFLLYAQTELKPIKQDEFVRLLYQLPTRPAKKTELIELIRKRGIDFELNSGIRSLAATKSGNDAELRRALEEATKKRLNPSDYVLPSEKEAMDILEETRATTLAVAESSMPDFVVKQLINRAEAYGNKKNWKTLDNLTVAVSFRLSEGERYKLLAINGVTVQDPTERDSYKLSTGMTSAGEFVITLTSLFNIENKADFKLSSTDIIRGHRTIVYEYELKNPTWKITLGTDKTNIGHRGRVWIDREKRRVLRIESFGINVPKDFPLIAVTRIVDYDWVTINEQKYLLPISAESELSTPYVDVRTVIETDEYGRSVPTQVTNKTTLQTRNFIRFRGYQKYGSELRIIDDEEVPEELNKEANK
jgi:hypothetical protein